VTDRPCLSLHTAACRGNSRPHHERSNVASEIAARHGCHPLRGVATYGDVFELTYVRGPSGIIVMLAQELRKS
jgi:hypothetical protein